MDDLVISLIRTNAAIGAAAGTLWIANRSLHLLDPTTTGITALAISVYYALARILELRWPPLGLLLLGSSRQPSYAPDPPLEKTGTDVTAT